MLRRLLATFPHNFWQNDRQQSLLIVALSLITSLWLWLEGGRVLDVESLQALWYANHTPHNLFEQLLVPLARNPDLAVAVMAALSTFSLWLFCRLARLTGIGAQTTFILFLLLNFNPEYNDVRLQISRFQPVLLLWLAGLYLFLAHYKNHIHLAFLGWATTAWLGALFVPIAAFWAGGFPLLFLLWPGRGNWRRRLCERGRFLLAYYALIALIIALVPAWRHAIGDWLPELIAQIDLKRSEIAFLINADNPVDLTITEGYLVALVLVALNAIKIMGPVITTLALLALSRRVLNTVLEKRVRLPIGAADVYVKVAGGIRLDEPAADLALCVAMASSFAGRLPRPQMVVCGEVGLSGEVRAVSQAEQRIIEAQRLGFHAAVLPMKNYRQLKGKFAGMELFGAETIGDALKCAMPKNI